jgi:hypothetical protein
MVYAVDWAECRRKAREPLLTRIEELESALRDIRFYVRDPDGISVFSLIEKRVNAALDEQQPRN